MIRKARDNKLNRLVAIKVLPADKVANAERKRRLNSYYLPLSVADVVATVGFMLARSRELRSNCELRVAK